MTLRRSSIFGVLGVLGILGAACTTGPTDNELDGDPGIEAPTGESSQALEAGATVTTAEAVARAKEWSDAKLQYCWAPRGGSNHAAGNYACSEICKREANPEWDPYRSDCSGLVSWAWGLPAPGRTTATFYPFKKDITVGIEAKDLRPGDAVNNDGHMMLFKAWITPGKRASFYEEPGCSSKTPYAHEVESNVTLSGTSITVAYNGMKFTAIRYPKLVVGDASPAPAAAAPAATPEPEDDGPEQPDNTWRLAPSDEASGCSASPARSGGQRSMLGAAVLLGLVVGLRRRRATARA